MSESTAKDINSPVSIIEKLREEQKKGRFVNLYKAITNQFATLPTLNPDYTPTADSKRRHISAISLLRHKREPEFRLQSTVDIEPKKLPSPPIEETKVLVVEPRSEYENSLEGYFTQTSKGNVTDLAINRYDSEIISHPLQSRSNIRKGNNAVAMKVAKYVQKYIPTEGLMLGRSKYQFKVKARSKSTAKRISTKRTYHTLLETNYEDEEEDSFLPPIILSRKEREIMRCIEELTLNTSSETTVISEIRRYHPLFEKLTFQGSRIIFKQGKIMKLKPSQILFKEGLREDTAFLVLYGKIVVRTIEEGTLGVVGPGESVGEEAVLMSDYRFRTETCVGEGKSCLLSIEKTKMEDLRSWLISVGLKSDYLLLFSVFRKCFDKKQAWRKSREDC